MPLAEGCVRKLAHRSAHKKVIRRKAVPQVVIMHQLIMQAATHNRLTSVLQG